LGFVLIFFMNKCFKARINWKLTKNCVCRYRAQLERQLEAVLGEKEELAKRLDLLRSKLEAANDDKNRQVHCPSFNKDKRLASVRFKRAVDPE
jgi:hypothetical protein